MSKQRQKFVNTHKQVSVTAHVFTGGIEPAFCAVQHMDIVSIIDKHFPAI